MQEKHIVVEISCLEVWRHISNYVDDDVDAELRGRLEHHFVRCRHCKAILDGTRNIVGLIGDDRAFEFPEALSQRLTTGLAGRISADRGKGE